METKSNSGGGHLGGWVHMRVPSNNASPIASAPLLLPHPCKPKPSLHLLAQLPEMGAVLWPTIAPLHPCTISRASWTSYRRGWRNSHWVSSTALCSSAHLAPHPHPSAALQSCHLAYLGNRCLMQDHSGMWVQAEVWVGEVGGSLFCLC